MACRERFDALFSTTSGRRPDGQGNSWLFRRELYAQVHPRKNLATIPFQYNTVGAYIVDPLFCLGPRERIDPTLLVKYNNEQKLITFFCPLAFHQLMCYGM